MVTAASVVDLGPNTARRFTIEPFFLSLKSPFLRFSRRPSVVNQAFLAPCRLWGFLNPKHVAHRKV